MHPVDPRAAAEIARYGSLDNAIAALWVDACDARWGSPVHDILNAALAEQSAQRTESIDERCFRLGLRAAEKDAEAERHMAAEAEAAGRAAHRRNRGETGLADSFDREARACLACAQDAGAEAERLRSQANSLRRAQAYAADVVALTIAAE